MHVSILAKPKPNTMNLEVKQNQFHMHIVHEFDVYFCVFNNASIDIQTIRVSC